MSCSVIFLARFTKNHQFFGLSPFNLTINRTMSRDEVLDFVMIAKKSKKKVRLKIFRFFWSGSSGFGSVLNSFRRLSPTASLRGAAATQGALWLKKSCKHIWLSFTFSENWSYGTGQKAVKRGTGRDRSLEMRRDGTGRDSRAAGCGTGRDPSFVVPRSSDSSPRMWTVSGLRKIPCVSSSWDVKHIWRSESIHNIQS